MVSILSGQVCHTTDRDLKADLSDEPSPGRDVYYFLGVSSPGWDKNVSVWMSRPCWPFTDPNRNQRERFSSYKAIALPPPPQTRPFSVISPVPTSRNWHSSARFGELLPGLFLMLPNWSASWSPRDGPYYWSAGLPAQDLRGGRGLGGAPWRKASE